MDCSLDEARAHLRQWYKDRSPVRVAFVGRGLKLSHEAGLITESSEREFTFISPGVKMVFDPGINSSAAFVPLGASASPPAGMREFVSDSDECAVIFTGALGDILIILQEKS
jgi:hypothetical protein